MMKLPTSLTIQRRLGVTNVTACAIWRAMSACRANLSYNSVTKALNKINDLLNADDSGKMAHGVETVLSYADDGNYSNFQGLEYVNMGDTYDMTVVYDHRYDKFYLNSWGDIVERQEKRFRDY